MSRQESACYFLKVDFKKLRENIDSLEGTLTHEGG